MTNSATLARVEAMARRAADATGRAHVVLNLNQAGAPLYVCRELHDRMDPARIVSRFDPAVAAPAEPAESVVGAPVPAADVMAYEVDRAEAIHALGQKSDAELRTLADHFRKVAPLAKLASNRQSSEAIVAACERLIARRGAMVPQPSQLQQAQAAPSVATGPLWYIETRTLRGEVVRRHGPFARDSREFSSAYHAEECAATGHNRPRLHDDPSAQRVFPIRAEAAR